jgi:hypothetical protein
MNSVKEDEKDGDVDVRVEIKPNTFELKSQILFEDDEDKSCKLETISQIDNKTENSKEFWELMNVWQKALGISEQMQGDSEDNRTLIKKIREKDKVWTATQGFIHVPLIEEQRKAVQKLSEEAQNSVAILGIERGGAMLAEQIPHDNRLLIEHQIDENGERSKSLETAALLSKLESIAKQYKDSPVTISIAETVVGGGSASGLINEIRDSKILENYPNLTLRFLLLQQTMHSPKEAEEAGSMLAKKVNPSFDEVRDVIGSTKVLSTSAGNLQVILSSTPYLLGEDVGYQLAKKGDTSQKPVVLFNIKEDKLSLKRITPTGKNTARHIIQMLVAGDFDDFIKDMK